MRVTKGPIGYALNTVSDSAAQRLYCGRNRDIEMISKLLQIFFYIEKKILCIENHVTQII